MDDSRSDEQVSRNLEGIECEKSGDIDRAILLYEKNISELTDTPHPYDRLSLIYHRQDRQGYNRKLWTGRSRGVSFL
jgi:hypothetical protein